MPNSSFKDTDYSVRDGVYMTNDGQWKWNASRQLWEEVANPMPLKTETTVNAANSMIFNIAVTTRAVVQQVTNAIVEPEKIIIAPEAVVALDQNSAILAIGVKHAKEFDGVDMNNTLVHVRQGI